MRPSDNRGKAPAMAFLPPEWACQEALMLTWPHEGTDWRPCLDEINRTYLEMADAVTRREGLIIVTPDAAATRKILLSRLDGAQMARVAMHECPTNDTWARDHGFISLLDGEGGRLLLDFRFNGWGGKFAWEKDNAINSRLHSSGAIAGRYVDNDDFVLEGGSIEADGNGTVLTTSRCLLAPNRNQPMTRSQIERALLERLHARRILWLEHGHLEGDDTDGHIDTLVRAAPGGTLLYVGCDDAMDGHHEELRLMELELRALRDADGNPYRLLRLPMADPIYHCGERLPATYANFVVINGAVIYPTYGQKENDTKAARAIAEAFPGREPIPIDSRTVVRQHGSLHCCTMQIPKAVGPRNGEE